MKLDMTVILIMIVCVVGWLTFIGVLAYADTHKACSPSAKHFDDYNDIDGIGVNPYVCAPGSRMRIEPVRTGVLVVCECDGAPEKR